MSCTLFTSFTFAYVPPSVLDGRVPIDVWKLPKAEPVEVVAWVRETVDNDAVRLAVEHLTNSTVQLVVGYARPIRRLL